MIVWFSKVSHCQNTSWDKYQNETKSTWSHSNLFKRQQQKEGCRRGTPAEPLPPPAEEAPGAWLWVLLHQKAAPLPCWRELQQPQTRSLHICVSLSECKRAYCARCCFPSQCCTRAFSRLYSCLKLIPWPINWPVYTQNYITLFQFCQLFENVWLKSNISSNEWNPTTES